MTVLRRLQSLRNQKSKTKIRVKVKLDIPRLSNVSTEYAPMALKLWTVLGSDPAIVLTLTCFANS